MISLTVIYTHCQKCCKPLRSPSAYAPWGCHRCGLLHWDWVRSAPLLEVPREPRKPARRRLPLWIADDLSDMDRRGEYLDRHGDVQWM